MSEGCSTDRDKGLCEGARVSESGFGCQPRNFQRFAASSAMLNPEVMKVRGEVRHDGYRDRQAPYTGVADWLYHSKILHVRCETRWGGA